MTLNPMTSYNSLNLMDVWNEARQLTSFSSNSKPLFVDKFNQIKHQLERIPNVSKLTQQIIYTAFKKAISDDSDWYNQLHTIQIYTRELLLRGIVNDLDFHQFTLDSLIDLTMESDYIAEDIIEKFKNHPAITKITQEDFVQQLIRAVKEERYTFVNY